MAISIDDELLSLAAAAKLLPGRPHAATIYRWTRRGVRGVRLESVLVAGRRYTSREALDRFIATTSSDDGEPVPTRTTRRRDTAIRAAERDLGL